MTEITPVQAKDPNAPQQQQYEISGGRYSPYEVARGQFPHQVGMVNPYTGRPYEQRGPSGDIIKTQAQRAFESEFETTGVETGKTEPTGKPEMRHPTVQEYQEFKSPMQFSPAIRPPEPTEAQAPYVPETLTSVTTTPTTSPLSLKEASTALTTGFIRGVGGLVLMPFTTLENIRRAGLIGGAKKTGEEIVGGYKQLAYGLTVSKIPFERAEAIGTLAGFGLVGRALSPKGQATAIPETTFKVEQPLGVAKTTFKITEKSLEPIGVSGQFREVAKGYERTVYDIPKMEYQTTKPIRIELQEEYAIGKVKATREIKAIETPAQFKIGRMETRELTELRVTKEAQQLIPISKEQKIDILKPTEKIKITPKDIEKLAKVEYQEIRFGKPSEIEFMPKQINVADITKTPYSKTFKTGQMAMQIKQPTVKTTELKLSSPSLPVYPELRKMGIEPKITEIYNKKLYDGFQVPISLMRPKQRESVLGAGVGRELSNLVMGRTAQRTAQRMAQRTIQTQRESSVIKQLNIRTIPRMNIQSQRLGIVGISIQAQRTAQRQTPSQLTRIQMKLPKITTTFTIPFKLPSSVGIGKPIRLFGKRKAKRGRRMDFGFTPISDPLSFLQTEIQFGQRGLIPRSKAVRWSAFKRTLGLRIPTAQQLSYSLFKGRKRKKAKK